MALLLDNGKAIPEEESLWIEPIPEEEYVLSYLGHRFSQFNGSPKLEIWFRVKGTAFDGRNVARYYNLESHRETTNGAKWKPKRGGDFLNDFVGLFGERLKETRKDRIPLRKWLSAQEVVGLISMCVKNAKDEEVPEGAQMAKVAKLLRIVDIGGYKTDSPSPCLTSNPSFLTQTQPPLVQNSGKPVQPWVSSKSNGNSNFDFYRSETAKALEMGAKTAEDVERITGGYVPACEAAWFLP